MIIALRDYQSANVDELRGCYAEGARATCTKCKSSKPMSAFRVDNRNGKMATECRDCGAERARLWRLANPGRNAASCKQWSLGNEERKRAANKAWRIKNAEKLRLAKSAWYQATKETNRIKKNAYQRIYERTRRKTDAIYSLHERMSRAIRGCLAGHEGKQGRQWETLVGYTLEELRAHIEKQFLPKMSWRNRHLWHVDHITPLSSFKITGANCAEFRRAWDLPNLRPIWAKHNISKSDSVVFLI